jgi:hypothetical protein
MPRPLFNRQENLMSSFSTVISVSALAFLTACAAPGGPASSSDTPAAASAHASHHPGTPSTAPMPGMQDRMKAMHEMHDKMMNAKTPAEREALMAEHMKSMQGGMDMMKRMGCMAPMGAGAGMSSSDMAQKQQAMAGCAQMMQMMMEMMGQRMPNAPASR